MLWVEMFLDITIIIGNVIDMILIDEVKIRWPIYGIMINELELCFVSSILLIRVFIFIVFNYS